MTETEARGKRRRYGKVKEESLKNVKEKEKGKEKGRRIGK